MERLVFAIRLKRPATRDLFASWVYWCDGINPPWQGDAAFAAKFPSVAAAENYAFDRLVGPNLSGELEAFNVDNGQSWPICRKAPECPSADVRLTMAIGTKPYAVRVLPPTPHADRSLRTLVQLESGGKSYNVVTIDNRHLHPSYLHHECDCPDYTFRRDNDARACKHIRALCSVGLLQKV